MRILFLAPVLLAGCAPSEDDVLGWMDVPSEPKVQAYLYVKCLELAQGPRQTHYNDLDEMVQECGRQATFKSGYCPAGRKCLTDIPARADVRAILPNQEQPQ